MEFGSRDGTASAPCTKGSGRTGISTGPIAEPTITAWVQPCTQEAQSGPSCGWQSPWQSTSGLHAMQTDSRRTTRTRR